MGRSYIQAKQTREPFSQVKKPKILVPIIEGKGVTRHQRSLIGEARDLGYTNSLLGRFATGADLNSAIDWLVKTYPDSYKKAGEG